MEKRYLDKVEEYFIPRKFMVKVMVLYLSLQLWIMSLRLKYCDQVKALSPLSQI